MNRLCDMVGRNHKISFNYINFTERSPEALFPTAARLFHCSIHVAITNCFFFSFFFSDLLTHFVPEKKKKKKDLRDEL